MVYDFKFRDKHLSLCVAGKYNVIIGLSGVGKTYMCDVAEDIRSIPSVLRKQPLRIAGTPDVIEAWSHYKEPAIIIIDECRQKFEWEQIHRLMKRYPNYYIICTREGDPKVPYGIDTTFKLVRKQGYFRMIPAYSHDGLSTSPHNFTGIITEDAGLGYKVVLNKTSHKVVPAKGVSNIPKELEQAIGRILVLFDGCGVGPLFEEIVYYGKKTNSILYDSKSFEWEVLSSVFKAVRSIEFSQEYWTSFPSEEDFYVSVLKALLNKYWGISYSKGTDRDEELSGLVALFTKGKAMIRGKLIDIAEVGGDASALYSFLSDSEKLPPSKGLKGLNLEND